MYGQVFCSLPHAAFVVDAGTLAILDYSDEAAATFSSGRLELHGTSFLQLHAADDVARASAALHSGSEAIRYAANLVAGTGKKLPADISARCVNCDGIDCLVVVVDESSRESVPAREVETELQILSSRVPVVLWTVDRDLRFVSASGSALELVPDAKPGANPTLWEYFRTSDPEFLPIASHLAALEGKTVSYEFELAGRSYECWLEPSRDSYGNVQGVVGVAIDHTEQRNMQSQLRLSEERNRALIDNATDVIYTHDLRGNITSISPAVEPLSGYSRQEVLGRNIDDLIAPEYIRIAHQDIEAKLRGEANHSFEIEVVRKDGQRVPAEINSRLIFRDGAPVGVQGIARDVTTRRRTEQALRDSEARFRAVAETAASGIFICTPAGFEYVNSATEEICGYSAHELATMQFWEIVHPDFRETVRKRGLERLAGKANAPSRYEFKLITKTGEERWVDFTAGVLEYNGHNALLGTAVDITERKRTEQELKVQSAQLEELFQTAPEGIVVLDSEGKVQSANKEFLSMFRFERDDVLGRDIDAQIVPANKREEAARLNAEMRAGNASSSETVRCRKDGTLVDVSILAKPLTMAEQQYGRFVIYRDISAHKRAERLRELQFTTTEILSRASDFESATGELLKAMASILVFDYARTWVTDGSLHCAQSIHTPGIAPLEHFATHAATSEDIRAVVANGEPIWVNDVRASGMWPDPLLDQARVQSLCAFPLRSGTHIYGVMELISCTTRIMDFELLKALKDIGIQFGQFVDRKHAERAVVESEAKFRAVADTAASAIFIIAGDQFLYVNSATEEVTGLTRSELLGRDIWSVIHSDDIAQVRRRRELKMRGVEPKAPIEFRVLRCDGEVRWVEYSSSMIQFEGQVATLATAFDITERKRSEQLQSALFRITSLASNTSDLQELYRGIHEIVGELMYVHNFYIALLAEDTGLIEFPYFVDEQDPEPPPPQQRSRGLTDYVLRNAQPLFANPEVFDQLVARGEVESRGAPSLDWVGVPLKSGNKAFGVLTVQSYSPNIRYGERERDVLTFVSQQVARAIENKRHQEALQHSEARYRSQVQSALYGLYRSSVDGRFLDVNPALVEMLGYSSREELLAINLPRDLYVNGAERDRILREVGNDSVIKGIEAHWRRKDGHPIVVRLSGRGGIRNPGEPMSFEMIAEDITERRQLEEQLRHSQKMEAVGRLAGGIAHDFNNLLTVIKGYSDLMLTEMRPGERMRSEVEEIRRAADRAASLTRQLLAFSRRQVLEPRVIDLNSVVSTMERLLKRLIGDDVDLHIALAPNLPAVKADPGQIEQVIMNLAVNARDAMPTGGMLTIETNEAELDNEYARENGLAHGGKFVMLAVSDNGTGMDAETRSHIFEPFFTTKEAGKGTGLGLSTVYGIVKQSGGHVTCYSEVNRGTTLKIYLPDAGVVVPHEHTSGTAPRLTVTGTCKERVLLVEDEDGVRSLVRAVLERDGYTVIEARNGAEALLASDQTSERIDLLLTDVVLAHMSGKEVAREIRSRRSDIKVLFISGYTEEAILHHGVLESGTAFLQKPFTPAALSRKVRDVLEGRNSSAAAAND